MTHRPARFMILYLARYIALAQLDSRECLYTWRGIMTRTAEVWRMK